MHEKLISCEHFNVYYRFITSGIVVSHSRLTMGDMSKSEASSAQTRVERWLSFGGTWESNESQPGEVTVRLLRCDAGEVVDEFTVSDEKSLKWIHKQLNS